MSDEKTELEKAIDYLENVWANGDEDFWQTLEALKDYAASRQGNDKPEKPVDPHVNPDCDHKCEKIHKYDHVVCQSCHWVNQGKTSNTGDREKDNGRVWWKSIEHAEFYYKNGRHME